MPPICQPPEVTNIINVVNTWLKWKNLNGPPRGFESYHPSSFGGCLRKAQYQRYAERGWVSFEEEAKDPKTIRIFDTGHSMHARWVHYFTEIGVLRGVWECTNPVCGLWDNHGNHEPEFEPKIDENLKISPPRKYGLDNKLGVFKPKKCLCGNTRFHYHELLIEDKELNFHGHCDQVLDFSNFDPDIFKQGKPVDVLFKKEELPKKPIVLDMKSINDYGFKGGKLDDGPSLVYKTQIIIYCNLLDLDYGIILYENKNDSSTKIYKVDRNPEVWNKIKEQANTLNEMVEEKMLPPPRPFSKDEYDCRYCEFQSICHSSKIWEDPDLVTKRLKFYGIFE